MKKFLKRMFEWLSTKRAEENSGEGEINKAISLLVRVRTRYTQFRLLSPDIQMEICQILDESWRILPENVKRELMRDQGIVLEESDVVPRIDHVSVRKTNDELQKLAGKYRAERDEAIAESRGLRSRIYDLEEEIDPGVHAREETEESESE